MTERKGDLVEAARAVRVDLAELVDEPGETDAALVGLLERHRTGEDVDAELSVVLSRDGRVVDWVSTFLEHGVPPDAVAVAERGIEALPGRGDPIDADRFECPIDGMFVFYRRRVGQPVPPCKDHHVALVPAP